MREHQTDLLPDGSLIDLDSYDWGDTSLRRRQKLFIVWYTTPNQKGFLNACKAALKAGYNPTTAYHVKNTLLKDDRILDIVNRFFKDNVKVTVKEAAQRYLLDKIKIAEFDPAKIYNSFEYENDDGNPITIPAKALPLEEIPEEIRKTCIKNVNVASNGVVTYELMDKAKAREDIIKLDKELNGDEKSDGFDVETTVDLIKENLATVKTTVRMNNQKVRENAQDYIENGENLPDFD